MGSSKTLVVGQQAEQLAFTFLREHDLVPLARNFRCRGGEIDLIMLDADCLTFIEVRFRSYNRFATAAATVDNHKQRKIIRTAAMFVAKNTKHASRTMRFDVVAVDHHQVVKIDWIKDAFRPNNSTL